jgi:hypothetical protein
MSVMWDKTEVCCLSETWICYLYFKQVGILTAAPIQASDYKPQPSEKGTERYNFVKSQMQTKEKRIDITVVGANL